ncbi:hypothetical protein GALMADRAFT_248981 [Galerina marginata CBS 339.88]|uniref:SET domain-containing protein n=1 Tax=Galerina marginata (strain CBS 339.88) TaxID=685588 RepID=A0A067SVY6_GALM3|nr:hypothetical protein GALMADRAFT_248981 [Galerina marginata CBS 339.88]
MPSSEIQPFFTWFQAHNGYIDTTVMDVVQLPLSEGGRGAVALVDIPQNHVIFSVPRSLILTTRTCALSTKIGPGAWRTFGLHQGWAGLILCMMWEAARGAESKWDAYFDMMPTQFNTPMFWNEDDLTELKGTSVVEKLGKDQAEKDYREKILPAIDSRPDLFPKAEIPTRYSLEIFHIMGTRILSRSFTLATEEDDDEDAGKRKDEEKAGENPPHPAGEVHGDEDIGNASLGSAMDVDEPSTAEEPAEEHVHEGDNENENENGDGADDDEEDESAPEVAMIPLADVLNARYKTDNVKLFYEPDCLRMVSTRMIKAGEQIWNTYGDLPNADLLRGFGHVDYLPLPYAPGEFGNPGDVIELRADLVVRCALDLLNSENEKDKNTERQLTMEDMEDRIDWWLEEGGDDTFTLEHPSAAPPPSPSTSSKPNPTHPLTATLSIILLSFTHLMLLTPAEWARAKAKSKPPKPLADARALRVVLEALRRRGEAYSGSLEEDTALLSATPLSTLSLNKRHALIVRMGEKRVLTHVRKSVEEILAAVQAQEAEAASGGRKNQDKDKSTAQGAGASGSRAGKRKADALGGGEGRKKRK